MNPMIVVRATRLEDRSCKLCEGAYDSDIHRCGMLQMNIDYCSGGRYEMGLYKNPKI